VAEQTQSFWKNAFNEILNARYVWSEQDKKYVMEGQPGKSSSKSSEAPAKTFPSLSYFFDKVFTNKKEAMSKAREEPPFQLAEYPNYIKRIVSEMEGAISHRLMTFSSQVKKLVENMDFQEEGSMFKMFVQLNVSDKDYKALTITSGLDFDPARPHLRTADVMNTNGVMSMSLYVSESVFMNVSGQNKTYSVAWRFGFKLLQNMLNTEEICSMSNAVQLDDEKEASTNLRMTVLYEIHKLGKARKAIREALSWSCTDSEKALSFESPATHTVTDAATEAVRKFMCYARDNTQDFLSTADFGMKDVEFANKQIGDDLAKQVTASLVQQKLLQLDRKVIQVGKAVIHVQVGRQLSFSRKKKNTGT